MGLKIKKLLHILSNPARLWTALEERGFFNWLPDRLFIRIKYSVRLGKKLDLNNPKTFNEKLQWLKLNDRKPEYVKIVDKFASKELAAGCLGEEHIIPTLGVWNKPEKIDFDLLPDKFVLKCNHDSGSVVICKDKSEFDRKSAIKKLRKGLRKNGFWYGREWPYKSVSPVILAEEYIEERGGLTDYKVHCFNGEPKFVLVCAGRNDKEKMTYDFYDLNWKRLPVSRPEHPNSQHAISKPQKLDELLDMSRKLSKGIPFVRTDFYIVDEKIYFGEMTFYPTSGFSPFVPEEWDKRIGRLLTLPTGE